MSTTASVALVFCLAIVIANPASAQVVNGSFEPAASFGNYAALPGASNSIPGWETTDTGVEWFDPSAYGLGPAPSGQYAVDLANLTFSAGGIQQTFATTPGASYQVNYWIGTYAAFGRDGTCEVVVSADGQSATHSMVNVSSVMVWEVRSFTFIADDASATLLFRCTQNANLHFANIDGVGVNSAVGNEDASWGSLKALYD